jgi:hypothetical protein
LESHAGDAGAGDQEGEEGEGGALRGEGEGAAGDWVSAEVIGGEIAFLGDGLHQAAENLRMFFHLMLAEGRILDDMD